MSIPTAALMRQMQCEIILAGRPTFEQDLHAMLKKAFYTYQLDEWVINPRDLCADALPGEHKRICDTVHWLLAPRGYLVERHLDKHDFPYLRVTIPPV